jgi:hypothetical protein
VDDHLAVKDGQETQRLALLVFKYYLQIAPCVLAHKLCHLGLEPNQE